MLGTQRVGLWARGPETHVGQGLLPRTTYKLRIEVGSLASWRREQDYTEWGPKISSAGTDTRNELPTLVRVKVDLVL